MTPKKKRKLIIYDFVTLKGLFILTVVTILAGTVFYHYVEQFSWIDAFYFSVITLTTVGYGDLAPKTDIGKLFTVYFILNGLGILTGFLNAMYTRRIENSRAQLEQANQETENLKRN